MKGQVVIDALKRKFRVRTDKALAEKLGNTVQALNNWKRRRTVTPLQIAGLVHRANSAGERHAHESMIRPIVEFYPIIKHKLQRKFILFPADDNDGRRHPYRSGLREELESKFGVYIFFDSRGQAIYIGRARRQDLWREMKGAFNRRRGGVQRIKRVRHPRLRVEYRTSDEKSRQIKDQEVPLHELALYFSAYEVADEMIDELEAMLVRSFANDTLNVRMERFVGQRRRHTK